MFLEVLLEIESGADIDRVLRYLRGKGFDPLPMKAGVLLSADIAALRNLLPGIAGTEAGELPIPADLKGIVRSIRLFKPRSMH